MKKTMSNFTKTILTILLTVIATAIIVFIIHIIRNAVILNHLSKVLNSNLNTNNYHYEEYIQYKDNKLIKEQYKKDNQYKEYTYTYNKADVHSFIQYSDGKDIIRIEDNNVVTNENSKERSIEDVISIPSSYINNLNLKKLVNTRVSFDKSYNAYIVTYGSVNIWFDASTGLPIRNVFGNQVHLYEFEFNNVTIENVAKPNLTNIKAQ